MTGPIVVLGGAGGMGRHAVRLLAESSLPHDIVVADRQTAAAAAVAAAHDRTTAAHVDLDDVATIERALDGASVVLNCAGPFYRFGTRVLDAAIGRGVHYLDICDDPAPTLALLERRDAVRDAGLTAVVGIGASPGVSNLLAVLAGRHLDEVHRVVTAWPEDPVADFGALATDGPPSAAAVHWVHQFSRPVLALRDGRLREVDALEAVVVDYPGVGTGTVTTVGHPEAVTLHHAFPGLRDSTNAMVISPTIAGVLRDVAAQVARGLDDVAGAALLRDRVAALDPAAVEPVPPFFWLFAHAAGVRDGREAIATAALTCYPDGGMAGATSAPLVVATELLLAGELPVGGGPPETMIPPDAFFARFASRCAGTPDPASVVRIDVAP